MKFKTLILLVVIIVTVLPLNSVQSKENINYTLDDALLLMYVSDAILAGESNLDQAGRISGYLALSRDETSPDDENVLIDRQINALIAQRNDL